MTIEVIVDLSWKQHLVLNIGFGNFVALACWGLDMGYFPSVFILFGRPLSSLRRPGLVTATSRATQVAHLEQEALKVTEDSHYAYILQAQSDRRMWTAGRPWRPRAFRERHGVPKSDGQKR